MTSPAHPSRRQADRRPEDQPPPDGSFRTAPLHWYGLDDRWRGSRRTGVLSTGPDGVVEYGTLAHGDTPVGRPDGEPQQHAVTVVTMARLPRRRIVRADGSPLGFVEATTVSTAAAVAGMALVDEQWPWHVGSALREDWMDQQRELAVELAESLDAPPWRPLTLHVDGEPRVFHYRESPYGWILAADLPECLLAGYGRGVSAYALAFTRADLDAYL